jgi:radical SAM superfamily enzyme YgiQ (UPF0313 family)
MMQMNRDTTTKDPSHLGEMLMKESSTPLNILMIMPKFPLSFWGLDYMFADILTGPRYLLPPLSLMTVASFLPANWNVRMVDENVRSISEQEWVWADVIMVSAMIVQTSSVQRLTQHAHRMNKPVVVGGPNPTMAPEHYPEADYIHRGEIGDATIRLWQDLAQSPGRPNRQKIYRVTEKVPLQEYPTPRHELVREKDYLSMSLQFAVGCPFNCEFCDIIEIYGRTPRTKSPEQVLAELDSLHATGHKGSVFFVDDNFIGSITRVKALLPYVLRWQEAHGYPFQFYTEASVNLAEYPDLLDAMRQAGFYAVFLGIETPELIGLKSAQKSQNTRRPPLESVRIIQDYGLEIWSGFILGFDTDTPETGARMADFIEASAVTMAMVNLLNAPEGTQLWRRLRTEGRLSKRTATGDVITDTNIFYKLGQEATFKMLKDVWRRLYAPDALLWRIRRNIQLIGSRAGRFGELLPLGVRLRSLPRILWHMGIKAPYRGEFWKLLVFSVRRGSFDAFMFQIGMAYHCIRYCEHVLAAPTPGVVETQRFASPQPSPDCPSLPDEAQHTFERSGAK